jgi:hypothetical protein
MDGFKKAAKLDALKEIMAMLGDMEAEPFMEKPEMKAVKVGILAKKPMGDGMDMSEDMEAPEGMEKPEEEKDGLEIEAKGESIEELKRKLADLLK